MLTDAPPRNRNRAGFLESDLIKTLDLPQNGALTQIAQRLESAMKADTIRDVRSACTAFLATASNFYAVPTCGVRVLAARPLRTREHGTFELFGDYAPDSMLIRVWMRTAVRKEVTSFGTFLSTLCHEFCHHLDFKKFGFVDSWHTRGFYERAGVLYHHARGTPLKRLFWVPLAGGRLSATCLQCREKLPNHLSLIPMGLDGVKHKKYYAAHIKTSLDAAAINVMRPKKNCQTHQLNEAFSTMWMSNGWKRVDGYRHDMAGIIASELAGLNISQRLGFINRLIAKGDTEGVKQEIEAVAKDLEQYATISQEKPKPAAKTETDNRAQELDDREFKIWVTETAAPINAAKTQAIKSELKQYLKGQSIDDETYQALEGQALRYLNDLLQADPNFQPTFTAYVENRDRDGLTRFMGSKIKELLPSKPGKMGPVEKAYKLFFRGVAPKKAPPQAGKPSTASGPPAPKGWEKVAKAPEPQDINMAASPFEMRFQKAAVLKNGKKVFWGDAAPSA